MIIIVIILIVVVVVIMIINQTNYKTIHKRAKFCRKLEGFKWAIIDNFSKYSQTVCHSLCVS